MREAIAGFTALLLGVAAAMIARRVIYATESATVRKIALTVLLIIALTAEFCVVKLLGLPVK